MNIISVFIIYLTVFRMAIITAGVISIILGYRLFCRGILSGNGSGKGTDVSVNSGWFRIFLRNAAPGTCFALFGVIIISSMSVTGSPQMTIKMMREANALSSGIESPESEKRKTMELTMKGSDGDTFEAIVRKGKFYEEQGDSNKAIAEYQRALTILASPMNNLAWHYQEQGEIEKALPLSRIAVEFSPDEANFLDTLAGILYKTGEYTEAYSLMQRAAELDAKYSQKLEKFRDANK